MLKTATDRVFGSYSGPNQDTIDRHVADAYGEERLPRRTSAPPPPPSLRVKKQDEEMNDLLLAFVADAQTP